MNTNNCLNCTSYRTTQTYDYCEATQMMVGTISCCTNHVPVKKEKPIFKFFTPPLSAQVVEIQGV